MELDRSNLLTLEEQVAFLIRNGDEAVARKRIEQAFHDPRIPGESFLGFVAALSGKLSVEQSDKCLNWVDLLVRKSGVSLLWLSRIQAAKDRQQAACPLAEKATTLSPKLVDAWIARVRLQPGKAEETIKQARTPLDEKVWNLLVAETEDVLRREKPDWAMEFKKTDDRRFYAQARLTAFAIRGKVTEAEEVLNGLIADEKARPEDVAWSKRNLALISITRGKADDRQKAVAVIKNAIDETGTLDDLRARAQSLLIAARHL
ncbi:MAG: hypothetical protein K8T89_10820, partial [Planctomycetes bacterium]|nr:hypothetical protein [Planctomycetota bacterium]